MAPHGFVGYTLTVHFRLSYCSAPWILMFILFSWPQTKLQNEDITDVQNQTVTSRPTLKGEGV